MFDVKLGPGLYVKVSGNLGVGALHADTSKAIIKNTEISEKERTCLNLFTNNAPNQWRTALFLTESMITQLNYCVKNDFGIKPNQWSI